MARPGTDAVCPRSSFYGVLVFPFIWELTEQMTYNGYLVSRFQVLCRSTSLTIAIVAFVWSFQHAFMPLTFVLGLKCHLRPGLFTPACVSSTIVLLCSIPVLRRPA
jgi:hypothetical protein